MLVCRKTDRIGGEELNGYLSRSEIDELCESLVLDYLKKNGQTFIRCVDIEGFLTDYLKYNLFYENIAEPDDPNKVAFKSNGVQPLHIKDKNDNTVKVIYPANTVVLDKYYLSLNASGERRFTIGHECGHILKERLYHTKCCANFYRNADFVSTIPQAEMKKYFQMEESQANGFSAGLLMPPFLVEQTLHEYHAGKRIPIYGTQILKDSEKVVLKSMADSLGVSYKALFYRLKHLKLFEERDMSEFIEQEMMIGGLEYYDIP